MPRSPLLLALFVALLASSTARGQGVIPHAQDKPPGPALSPEEAIKKMTVPEGFSVELVAAEPDVVNPVAMTIDDKGRFWIAESIEYPRREAGPGRDRIKVLEDTDGDGRTDKSTIFADGLNIPSGIAIGYGGVWVANAPDILFLQDTDGDGQADRREVVVTGFGRDDTHELPNSLTWGPDGWLYGLNGVFNQSVVKQDGREYRFTCAMFRIDPRTRRFELFCEGTSNPWGIAWDSEGSGFVSACVIDHLWHLTETGYYHRQGGPYPAFTWKLGSIVGHVHQKAAYCGLHYFDSDAYPERFRGKLFMGNIHGNCINIDALTRDGATYFAKGEPDLLTANDAWFMPVVQKTGPDGSLYILDWYDRYHCYQDANRDPAGIDRLHGRLYRVRYKDTPPAAPFDLAAESDEQLIRRLHSPNVFYRDHAQRLLAERNHAETRPLLEQLVLNDEAPRKARMHALWALVGTGALDDGFHRRLLEHGDAGFRAWGVRTAGNFDSRGGVSGAIREKVISLAADASPDVRVQVAIAATKLREADAVGILMDVLARSPGDKLIPNVVWQNLHPLLEEHGEQFLKLAQSDGVRQSPAYKEIMPRAIDRILSGGRTTPATVVALLGTLTKGPAADTETARKCLSLLSQRVQDREIAGEELQALKTALAPEIEGILADANHPLRLDAGLLAAAWGHARGIELARQALESNSQPEPRRLAALQALIASRDESALDTVAAVLSQPERNSAGFRGAVLAVLGRLDSEKVAVIVLAAYGRLEPDLQPKAIELLTQRAAWGQSLLQSVGEAKIPATALNLNQVRRLQATGDPALLKLVQQHWGAVRSGRNPEREQVIAEVRKLLAEQPGDPYQGQAVFQRVCAQCHKIYGQGQEVGPDITSIGRTSMDLLLSNVLDPSLVIGSAYQAMQVRTADGRVLTGIVTEDGEQRMALKLQGGKLETLARDQIDEQKVSEVSMMPEDLEKQLKPDELRNLFAYLALDKPPEDPQAKRLPDTAPPQ